MPSQEADPIGVQRGNYKRSLAGPLFLAVGRITSIPLQQFILAKHPLSLLGVPRPPTDGTITLPFLPPQWTTQPLFPFLITLMPAVLVTKQILWMSYCNELITLPYAFFAVLSTYIYEGVTTLVFTSAAVNPLWSPTFVKIATAIHVTAAVAELGCELHRRSFKADPKNRGKLCTTGLWGLCRHPNYAANVIYGTAYGFAAGGPVYAAMTGGMYISNFTLNAIPPKEEYLAKKYGVGWEKYKKDVRWKLFPGIY
jgi:protein-S-isoprenylcysteine O-methyltransferase Ste14